jgi:hypothetical protein
MTPIYSDPDFDPRIADWLEDLVDRAPSTTLPAVTAAVPLITQRQPSKLPWRTQTMNRFALFWATAAAVVAVGIGGLLVMAGANPGTGGDPAGTAAATSSAGTVETTSPPTAPPSPIPRPSAAIDNARANEVARAFQGLMNDGQLEEAADLVWVGATINGRPTFSREDVIAMLHATCGARITGDWKDPLNQVAWDTRLTDRPGFDCPQAGAGYVARFTVENGLIVVYMPKAQHFE